MIKRLWENLVQFGEGKLEKNVKVGNDEFFSSGNYHVIKLATVFDGRIAKLFERHVFKLLK